jgi:hypothetical protein
MAFTRGLAPKEAMDIGEHHIAPLIESLYNLNPNNMMDHPDGTYGPERVRISPTTTEDILILINREESPNKLRFYAMLTEDGKFIRLNKYINKYVKFNDKTYKIKEPK